MYFSLKEREPGNSFFSSSSWCETIFMHHSSNFHYCNALRLLALAASCLCLNIEALDVDGWSALMGLGLMGSFLDSSVEASRLFLLGFSFPLTSIFLSSLDLFANLARFYISWQLANFHFPCLQFTVSVCVIQNPKLLGAGWLCGSILADWGVI